MPAVANESDAVRDSGPRRVVIQRNPTSGSGRGRQQIRMLIRHLREAGFVVRLFANRDRLDDFVQRSEIRNSIFALVAAGGDGTVAGLCHRHPDLPIAVLPMGTENLVARHLNIPRCGRTVANMIRGGKSRVFDTAFVNDQRFLLMASAGVDAEVVHRLSTERTGNISYWSYLQPIARSFLKYHYPPIDVCSRDGKVLATGSHVIVTNIPEYGFRMKFSPQADPADGKLDVRIYQHAGRQRTILHALRTRAGWGDRPGDVVRLQAESVELKARDQHVPVQFDGDPVGLCPVQIRIDPQSLRLFVPT
ncbi:MAG: diacylglycerol kinase family protein [Fuerstiella sp.]